MKKGLLSLAALLGFAGMAFAGTGTAEDPYTVDDLIEMGTPASPVANIYVQGYIVGSVDGQAYNTGCNFGLTKASNTNILIASSSQENDKDWAMPVQLPAGTIRDALSISQNPDNLGHQVLLKGSWEKYFSVNGIKSVTEYKWIGEAPTPGGGNTGGGNTGDDDAYLTSGLEPFTIDNVSLPEGLDYVWSWDAAYGAKASAYVNNTNHATEAYLISPEIKLEADTKTATFSQALNFLNGNNRADYVNVVVREGNGAWQTVNVSAWPAGTDWAFIDECEIDLSAYAGKTIQIAFRYTSSSSCAPTWEVKRLKIGATGGGNTPATVMTVPEALAWLNAGNSGNVQATGYITSIKEVDTGQYGNATYYIGETATSTQTITVYRGFYLGGAKFTSTDQIRVGDLVVVEGNLELYGNYKEPEFTSGNKIVSINGQTNGGNDNPGENPNPDKPTGESVTFDFTNPDTLGISYIPELQENDLTGLTISNTPVSLSFANNGTATAPRLWYSSGNYTMRFYKDNVLTFSVPSEYVLTGIVFNGTSIGTDWSYSNGSLSGNTWTPSSPVSTVEIGKTATGNNPAIKTITVYYDNAGSGVDGIMADDSEAVYFNLQGQKVVNPDKGIYIKVVGNKAVKVLK